MVVYNKRSQPISLGYYENGSPTNKLYASVIETYDESLVSEGHYRWQDPPYPGNVGGDFYATKENVLHYPSASIHSQRPGSLYKNFKYNGSIAVNAPFGVSSLSTVNPDAFAGTAWDRLRPEKPSFEGLNALFELKDVPGMLRQRFTRDLRGAANFHLATQFGWLPLLRDVRNFVQTQRSAQKRLTWLIRNNGKPVRRRIEISNDVVVSSPVVENTFNVSSTGWYTPFTVAPHTINSAGMTRTNYEEVTRRKWASARMRYWLPPGPQDVEWTKGMLSRIYGLRPTPSVVYNAVPWSWLVDWFTNLGQLIENVSPGVADRLAADYVYIMESNEIRRITTVELSLYGSDGSSPVRLSASAHKLSSKKKRVMGSPFGFNVDQGTTLTGMQLSILGALGLSRLR